MKKKLNKRKEKKSKETKIKLKISGSPTKLNNVRLY